MRNRLNTQHFSRPLLKVRHGLQGLFGDWGKRLGKRRGVKGAERDWGLGRALHGRVWGAK